MPSHLASDHFSVGFGLLTFPFFWLRRASAGMATDLRMGNMVDVGLGRDRNHFWVDSSRYE